MGKYRLREKADQDIQGIFEFGVERFGIAQTEIYLRGLHKQLDLLADKPHIWPHIKILNMSFQRCVYESHSIYYQQANLEIVIVRILGQQDVDQAFLD